MRGKNTIPFYLHYHRPYRLLILNNNLVGFERWFGIVLSPERIYRFLHLLYQNEYIQKIIPNNFQNHFEQPLPVLDIPSYPCLSGDYFENPHTVCFICNMKISTNYKNPKIILRDLADINFDYNFYKLDYPQEVILSPKEAFFIFANLCVENTLLYGNISNQVFLGSTNPAQSLQNYLLSKKNTFYYNSERTKEITEKSLSFTLKYLQYIQELLDSGEIKPDSILFQNGLGVLGIMSGVPHVKDYLLKIAKQFQKNYNTYSLIEKTLYFTLILKCLDDLSVLNQEIISAFPRNPKFLQKVENELTRRFLNSIDDVEVQPIEDTKSLFEKYNFQKL